MHVKHIYIYTWPVRVFNYKIIIYTESVKDHDKNIIDMIISFKLSVTSYTIHGNAIINVFSKCMSDFHTLNDYMWNVSKFPKFIFCIIIHNSYQMEL